MEIYSVQREYTEEGVKYIFRDVTMEDGTTKVQHLVLEPWGEEIWTDNEPAENEVLGARPYDQSERQLERAKRKAAAIKATGDKFDDASEEEIEPAEKPKPKRKAK